MFIQKTTKCQGQGELEACTKHHDVIPWSSLSLWLWLWPIRESMDSQAIKGGGGVSAAVGGAVAAAAIV